MRTPPSHFSDEQLQRLIAILQRANPSAEFVDSRLADDILNLLYAVGTTNDGSDHAIAFTTAAENDLSHEDLAKQFRAIASSDDPLSSEHCFGLALAELSAAARNKWSSRRYQGVRRTHPLHGVSSSELSPVERTDIKELARQLAAFHQSQVRRQRPRKNDLDTLLESLADIYLSAAGLDNSRYDLPHSKASIFIGFCHAALAPFFDETESSAKALSNRWKRLKDLAKSARS